MNLALNWKLTTPCTVIAKESGLHCLRDRSRCRNYIFLVDGSRYELEAVEPDHVLLVVRVGPEGVEDVIGTNGKIGIVADEAATEPVTGIDRVRADHLLRSRADLGHIIIQAGIVDVITQRQAINATSCAAIGGCTGLPR